MMPRCAISRGVRCAWNGLCAPGRCIAIECADSPLYAVFTPRLPLWRRLLDAVAALGLVAIIIGVCSAAGLGAACAGMRFWRF